VSEKTVAVRSRKGGDQGTRTLDEILTTMLEEIHGRNVG